MKIAYTHSPDDVGHPSAGILCIVHAKEKELIEKDLALEPGTLTQEQYEKIIWDGAVHKHALNPVIIADDLAEFDSLSFREFRNAVILVDGKFSHDLEKARAIQLEHMRIARKPLLDALDVESIQAMENGDTKQQELIVAAKNKLRAITDLLKTMKLTSLDDIRNAYPNELRNNQ